jgi:transposase InsO family protein
VPTLRRWYYRYQRHGIEGLRPLSRRRGNGLKLTTAERDLICEIRRQRPGVAAEVIVRTLEADGRLARGRASANTVRRLLRARGLDRKTLRQSGTKQRRARWEAEAPMALWHADVCHGPALRQDNRNIPLRIHAILDDASRYIVAIQAASTEREVDMLALCVKAARLHGLPRVLYLDNGSTYSGQALATACARLSVNLVHAKPYDPQARGKMERFWRTLRENLLDHIGHLASLHDVQVRLLAFLDKHYHVAPHAGLIGKTPAQIFTTTPRATGLSEVTQDKLKTALTVRDARRVKRDGTVQVGGLTWELEQGFLAGKVVTIARTLLDQNAPPWVELDGKTYALKVVDPIANAKRRLTNREHRSIDAIDFDPAGALLNRLLHKEVR